VGEQARPRARDQTVKRGRALVCFTPSLVAAALAGALITAALAPALGDDYRAHCSPLLM
jgi:hypothetical protein